MGMVGGQGWSLGCRVGSLGVARGFLRVQGDSGGCLGLRGATIEAVGCDTWGCGVGCEVSLKALIVEAGLTLLSVQPKADFAECNVRLRFRSRSARESPEVDE